MLILGIDTCTETIDAALVEDGRMLAERRGVSPRQHLTRLMPYVAEIFEEAGRKPQDVNLIALTNGPGSFTGIRLGMSTAKTLGQALNVPLAPVNTLDALAMGCEEDGIIIPSMDARKFEVFYTVFEKTGGALRQIHPYERQSVDEYFAFLKSMEYEKPVVTGSVFWRYGRQFDELQKEIRRVPEQLWTPRGEIIATMGRELFERGQAVDFAGLNAFYGRAFECTPPEPLV